MVAVHYGRQRLSSQRAIGGRPQYVPDTARLIVNKAIALATKAELAAVQMRFEHPVAPTASGEPVRWVAKAESVPGVKKTTRSKPPTCS